MPIGKSDESPSPYGKMKTLEMAVSRVFYSVLAGWLIP